MKKVPYTDRKLFWMYQAAAAAFEQAGEVCDYLLSGKLDGSAPLSYPLMVALVVLYARPFKQRRSVRLPVELVPAEFSETHQFVIQLRDKMFAHLDSDGPQDDKGDNLNKVTITASGQKVTSGSTYLILREKEIRKLKELTRILARKTAYHADKIWNRYMRKYGFSDGEYEVNISETNDEFLVPEKNMS